ncbi:hypothetical protein [Saccharothrix xinjiangensis]|uniref:Uncharacterized protein n=1 Tax=Saccharothrix xinjiangensis TaxID=204798 RepID=A0ABV9XXC9_9PSEU
MHCYHISKYDPARAEHGSDYLAEQWTSVSDVGKVFGGRVVSEEEYLRVEDAYLSCARHLAERAGVESLLVRSLEVRADEPAFDLHDGAELPLRTAIEVCREMLREGTVWCRLHRPGVFYLHVGYDYHLYVGTSVESLDAARRWAGDGVFVEAEWPSPYLDVESEEPDFVIDVP